MFKIYIGVGIFTTFALAGCLSTQYAGGYEETYEPVNAVSETRARPHTFSASHHVTPAKFEVMRCPAGTTPHAKSGTCLMDTPPTALPASAVTMAPTARPQNLIPAATTTQSRTHRTNTQLFGRPNYRVKSGDTVYSLARARCLPVGTLQVVNGLDEAYRIHVGDGLHLPASQC